jgi:DNA-binding NtrC family response regulator
MRVVARILLVEDEPVVRRLVTTLLASDGFEVRGAGSVLEAKMIMEGATFDLIVADYTLPDGNADELYTWVKVNHPELTKKFILTTGWLEKEGFPIILEKPFHLKELEDLVLRVLQDHSDSN